MADELTFKVAGLPIPASPLPTLTIELTADRGFVLEFITENPFSSQILEHCAIGELLTLSVGRLNGTGTVAEIEAKSNYSRIILINLLGVA